MAWVRATLVALFLACGLRGQVIEYDSRGLHYQVLTKNGLTVMCAPLSLQMHQYYVLQVAVTNGAPIAWSVKPEDFTFVAKDGSQIHALSALDVVNALLNKAGRSDVVKLVTAYESALSGMNLKSSTGYELRRQSALAEVSSARLKAAAAAAALAFVSSRLEPGQETDGAIFFPSHAHGPAGPGRLLVRAGADTFEFTIYR